jgi:thiamine biosynthesis protein ThiI
MKFDTILVRYGEIGLKSVQTRPIFEKRLVSNIKKLLNKHSVKYKDLFREWGRVYIKTDDETALPLLKTVFGVVSFSPAATCKADISEISKLSTKIAVKKLSGDDTFAVRATRQGAHAFKSRDIKMKVGADIQKATKAGVNLNEPSHEVFVEVRNKKAYVFVEKQAGPGGIPQGVEGNVLGVFREGEPFQAAAVLMAKRGCEIEAVIEKDMDLSKLKHWLGDFKVHTVDSGKDIFKEAERITKQRELRAVFTADTLTKDNLANIQNFKKLKLKVPVFRPLIGLDEKQIKQLFSSL